MKRFGKFAALLVFGFHSGPSYSDVVPDCGLYVYRAEIVRVIDGDTVVANIDLGFNVWRHNEHLRLLGIDTPERGQDGFAEAREFIISAVDQKDVYICTIQKGESDLEKTGSFGRYLATLYVDGINLNQLLVSKGLAIELR